MWHRLKACVDSRFLGLVTRPLVGLIVTGFVAGVLGSIGGLVYGTFHNSFDFAKAGGLRLAVAGAVAGFIVGLWSALDRLTWPPDERGGSDPPHPKNGEIACFDASNKKVLWLVESRIGPVSR
jgi:hypothetical protein